MRLVHKPNLFVGHAGDLDHPAELSRQEIWAIVQLAVEEPMPRLGREVVFLRFPFHDGPGNRHELLDIAIQSAAALIEDEIPTIICCSNGMSRSPSIAACALSVVQQTSPDQVLADITRGVACDVSPHFWVAAKRAAGLD